jgi:ubiquinone/menaquinone biosynthesis C-methylase UbiE
MNTELNLLKYYPKSNASRLSRTKPSEIDKAISSQFELDYFDGSRQYGYGGYHYNEKYWTKTAQFIVEHYNLSPDSMILDIGCAKGFLIKDLLKTGKVKNVFGIDISSYAVNHSEKEIKGLTLISNAKNLPFKDKQFDLVLSINTIHNLEIDSCINALSEIERVSKKNSFVMLDGWDTQEEKNSLDSWILTAKTVLSRPDWLKVFQRSNYKGDYFLWKFE